MTGAARPTRWMRRGIWLVSATMVYNAAEAAVALWAGVRAASIALVGFGLDSMIELTAASMVLWRLRVEARGEHPAGVTRAERRVGRFVGATFFLLAAYVVGQSAWIMVGGHAPGESVVGLVLAALSLTIMPLIAMGKLRAARAVHSRALAAEAKETLACSYLSLCLLVGLGANAVVGWWWADPVAALLMVPWLVREGLEGFEGDDA